MTVARAGELLGGRYVLVEPLGEGSSAAVFSARDRLTGELVAVKLLRGEDALQAVRNELSVAYDADHPAIARAMDAGVTGDGGAFLVLELAGGEPFDRALAEADPATVAGAVDALAAGLAFLHARGLVHGDLKPDNVRVQRQRGRVVARLLDLGLARPAGAAGGGTTAYAAPETFGGGATVASDLFSLGVMLHEVLTGRSPYGDPSDPEYLGRLMQAEPPTLDQSVPPGLAEIVRRLLAPQPEARPPSAGELRAALSTAVDEMPLADEHPASPPLLEREGALGRARRILDGDAPARLSIRGAPGTGRTRLMRRLAAEARLAGTRTIELGASSGAGPLLRTLVAEASRLGAEQHAERAEAVLSAPAAEPHARFAAPLAVLGALEAAAEASGGLVVAVDDLDRADAGAREAVEFLAGGAEHGTIGWILVGGPDAGARVEALEELTTEELTTESTRALLQAMLPGLDGAAELAELAHARTTGNPRRLVDGVHALVREGAVRFGAGQWRRAAEGIPRHAFEPPSDDDGAAVETLPAEVRETLAEIAVDGGTFERAAARMELTPDRRARARKAGLEAGVLRSDGDATRVTSEVVRERLAGGLDPATAHAVRERAAQLLRDTADPGEATLRARHLRALGCEDEARREARRAADLARAGGDLRAAVGSLETLRAWAGAGSEREAIVLEAELRAALGEVDEALEVLEHAAATDGDDVETMRARGRVLGRAGRYEAAIEALEKLRHPGSGLLAEDRYWLGWAMMMRGRYDDAEQLAAEPCDEDRDAARLGRLRGTIAWHRGEPEHARELLRTARDKALHTGDPLLQVEVEQSLATAERLAGDLDAAAARYDEAATLCRTHGYASVLAKVLNNLAIVEYLAGRWEGARHAWEAMQDLAVRLGSHEEVLLAHNNLGLLYKDRGELDRARRNLERAVSLARQRSLQRYETMALGNLAEVELLAGRTGEAEQHLDAAERLAGEIDARDELLECRRRRAQLALAQGSLEAALEHARQAAQQAEQLGATLEEGNARRVMAEAARRLGRLEAAREHLVVARERVAEAGTRLERARVQLEQAQLLRAEGRREEARSEARAAAKELGELGALLELELARQIEEEEPLGDGGQTLLELLGRASEADEVGELLDGVLATLLELARADRGLVIVLDGDEGPYVAAHRSRGAEQGAIPVISRGIADRVVASGQPLVLANVGDELDIASRASVVAMGLRAAVCAPLGTGSQCLGLLYIDSREGRELARLGPKLLEATSAIVTPALHRLLERERESERRQLLQATAIDRLESVAGVDATLELLEDEDDPERRRALLREARAACARMTTQGEGLLDLLRIDEEATRYEPEQVDVHAVVACALDSLPGLVARAPELRIAPEAGLIRGHLEHLASVLARAVELLARPDPAAPVVIRVRDVGTERPNDRGLSGWRPGATAGRRFVRFDVEARGRGSLELGGAATPDALALRAARRVVRRAGGRIFTEEEGEWTRIAMELEVAQAEEQAA